MRVTAHPFTTETFAPFGEVIHFRRPGLGRTPHAATLENRRPAAAPNRGAR